MPTKKRIITVSILILLGGALFFYCAFSNPTDITSQAKAGSATIASSEAASVKETSTGSEEQKKSDQSNQSRSQSRSRPRSGAI
jgi:outer membrane lipoprotein-sorting protein